MPWNPFRRKPEAMVFRLAYEPIPENAGAFAAQVVENIEKITGPGLDYSPGSLQLLDRVLEDIRAEDPTGAKIKEILFGLGCYLGEVFARHAGGNWRRTEETPLADVESLPLVIELPNGNVINPLGKVFKRVQLGPGEDVRFFWEAFRASGTK